MFYVYAHYKADDPTGVPFYIGKGKSLRELSNKRNQFWKNIVAKHGFISKKIAENLTEQEAWDLEKSLILTYGKLSDGTGCLCNIANGGEGASGTVHTENTKEKWSVAKKGKTWEEIYGVEQAQLIRAKRKLTGRKPHTEETKKKMAESKMGERNPMFRKSPTPEHSRKLSEAKIGKPSNTKGKQHSEKARQNYTTAAIIRASNPEIRKKISDSNMGKKDSEETKAKKSQAAKLREATKKLLTIKEIK
jgi:hypothetical protein